MGFGSIGKSLGGGLTGLGLGKVLSSSAFKGPSSELQIKQLPGVFGASPESGRLATTLEQLLRTKPTGVPFEPSQAQGDILSSLLDLVGGETAARGLGVPTEGARLQAVAPTFAGFAEQEASRELQARQQDILGLLELAGLSMPQVLAGQQQKPGGLGRALLGAGASGLGSFVAGGGKFG